MDKIVKIPIHEQGNWALAPLRRSYPSRIEVGSIGYVPHKEGWVDHVFDSFNFSFILSGRGEYRVGERSWVVEAPCVIIQAPGIHHCYGPSREWEELYLIYPADQLPALRAMNFAVEEKYLWQIRDPGPTRTRLTELMLALQDVEADGVADRIDRICEFMVLESLLGQKRPDQDEHESAIRGIQKFLEENWKREHDFDELGLDAGFSPSTFRRLWAKIVGPPPARYLMQFRINKACRLLLETRRSVVAIAEEVGFCDQLYFSRRFRQTVGIPPTEYRRHYGDPLSLIRE